MTFKTTVRDRTGAPIAGVVVTANDEMNGESFVRTTDGEGYADVAMLGSCAVGDRVSLVVLDPQLRFKGEARGDALVIEPADRVLEITLDPFV